MLAVSMCTLWPSSTPLWPSSLAFTHLFTRMAPTGGVCFWPGGRTQMQRGAGSGGRGRGRGGSGGRGGGGASHAGGGGGSSRRDADEDGDAEDEIVGFGDLDDDEEPAGAEDEDGGSDPLDRETAAEKRVRLAKQYLDVLARPAGACRPPNPSSDVP